MEQPPTKPSTRVFDRVQNRAVSIPIIKLLLSLISLPFYVLGAIAALIWIAISWSYAALFVGFSDTTERANRKKAMRSDGNAG